MPLRTLRCPNSHFIQHNSQCQGAPHKGQSSKFRDLPLSPNSLSNRLRQPRKASRTSASIVEMASSARQVPPRHLRQPITLPQARHSTNFQARNQCKVNLGPVGSLSQIHKSQFRIQMLSRQVTSPTSINSARLPTKQEPIRGSSLSKTRSIGPLTRTPGLSHSLLVAAALSTQQLSSLLLCQAISISITAASSYMLQ